MNKVGRAIGVEVLQTSDRSSSSANAKLTRPSEAAQAIGQRAATAVLANLDSYRPLAHKRHYLL